MHEVIRLDKGAIFVPEGRVKGVVLYFPGCAASLFFRSVGLAGLMLSLRAGYAVILPERHLCCGYPLLAAGLDGQYTEVNKTTMEHLAALCQRAALLDLSPDFLLTSCGTCREGLDRLEDSLITARSGIKRQDVVQFLSEHLPPHPILQGEKLLYHAPCHAEWTNVRSTKAAEIYAAALSSLTGADVAVSPKCCGESGMGAITSPGIFNRLRERKARQLAEDFTCLPENAPVLVGCPSCKQGISRTLIGMKDGRPVLHALEFLAITHMGEGWRRQFPKMLRTIKPDTDGVRKVDLAALGAVELTEADNVEDDDH